MENSTHNQKVRDKFLSEHESLVQESNAPLEARDNCNQEATRRLFQEDGRSDFEHQVWRETEMLPEMIRLHQVNYLKLNPQEHRVLGKYEISFAEHIKYEQEVDDDGQTEQDLAKITRLIAPICSRHKLEGWAAEIYLQRDKTTHHKKANNQVQCLDKNNHPELGYAQLLKEAVITQGMHKQAINQAKDSANKAITRALKGKSETDLPIKIQERGTLDQYMITKLGKPVPNRNGNQLKFSPLDCMYQKIIIRTIG